jgi:predicted nucleic-acid-binding protein
LRKIFVDTNLFIRYLTNDVPAQIDKVERLFDLAEKGEVKLVTGPPVFFEIAWTLKSFYNMSRKRIYECLSAIIGLPGLEVTDLDILEEAIDLYNNTDTDFSDAYISALSKNVGADSIATFNVKHFKNLDVQVYPLK